MIKKSVSLLLSALFLVGAFAGCSVNNDETSPSPTLPAVSTSPGGTIGGDIDDPKVEGIQYDAKYRDDLNLDPDQYKGKTLTIWTFWDLNDTDAKLHNDFEAATGCKIEYVNKQYETYESDLVKAIAAGSGPDVCYFGSEVIPSYVKKDYLTPVSDYLDMKKVQFSKSQSIMDFYTFNGKLYAMPDAGANTSRLYFRKDLFANAALPNPYELWKAGEWTWDRFVKLAQDVKENYQNGDGGYDVWGYYSWQWDVVLYSNGANYVKWEDGKPYEGLSDPKAIRAMEWRRALTDQYDIIAPYDPDNSPEAMLTKGSIAMMYWGDWLLSGLRESLGDKLGIAPFPTGPDATAPFGDSAAATNEGIAGFCKNPELAALFLLFKRLPINAEDEAEAKAREEADRIELFGSIEEYNMSLEMGNYAVINPALGFTGLQDVIDAIINHETMTPAQAVEAYKNVAQNKINETWGQT